MIKSLITFLLSSSISSLTFADSLEFREFTLKPVHGGKQLTTEQIHHAIVHNHLGTDKSVTLEIKDDQFKHSDQKEISYASEYNPDHSISEFEKRSIGLLITGSIQTKDNSAEIKFSYKNTTKTSDIIYGSKDDRAILTPVFEHESLNYSVTLDKKNPHWLILKLNASSDGSQTYCAMKLITD